MYLTNWDFIIKLNWNYETNMWHFLRWISHQQNRKDLLDLYIHPISAKHERYAELIYVSHIVCDGLCVRQYFSNKSYY